MQIYRNARRQYRTRSGVTESRHQLVGLIADTSQSAAATFFPNAAVMNAIGRERGWGPIGRSDFEAMRGPGGALLVGRPQEVADKILREHEIFGNDRFLLQMSIGAMPHADVLRAIELVGTRVAPRSVPPPLSWRSAEAGPLCAAAHTASMN